MLTEAQYAKQQRKLGHRIHEHGGVFWEEVYPFYCKPAFVYKAFDRGSSRPARLRSLLGYSHQVCRTEQGNRTMSMMVLERPKLDGFELLRLPSKKRNNVRRAMENCEVKPIVDLDAHLERIREINVSQALRHEQNIGSQIPVRRYTEEADSWRAQIRSQFALEGREWWGAFVNGVLAAYLRFYQVEDVRVIQHAKADADYYKFYPMDALYFTVLSEAATTPSCLRIVNGRPMHPSLNHFKEQFLFEAVEFPWYSTHAGMVELGKRLKFRWAGRRHAKGPEGLRHPTDGTSDQGTT